jgi:hypothetical protein
MKTSPLPIQGISWGTDLLSQAAALSRISRGVNDQPRSRLALGSADMLLDCDQFAASIATAQGNRMLFIELLAVHAVCVTTRRNCQIGG